MSDFIKHECGIALIRLLQPLDYYTEKYGTPLYGLNKLYLLMEKQHNRGQDGAGIASIKLNMPTGSNYMERQRSTSQQAIQEIFGSIYDSIENLTVKFGKQKLNNTDWLKMNVPFLGEVLLGHLRYGTHGSNDLKNCHPVYRKNNWMTRNLALAGNFNMTNVEELMQKLISLGQHPKEDSDTVTVLEKIGHFLDVENQRLFDQYKSQGYTNQEITHLIAEHLDVQSVLVNSAVDFDGGYAMAGIVGHGDAFLLRDPNGIRPAFWYADEEIAVVASERPAIQTAFKVRFDQVHEVQPGHALVIKRNGKIREYQCVEPREKKSCSFERIYFSRGTDRDIYKERQKLGELLVPQVLEAIKFDMENTVFSFIPNTAEVAYYGMAKGLEDYLNKQKLKQIKLSDGSDEAIQKILNSRFRIEKIAVKDAKLRTFITSDASRNELVSHVYDVTYGLVRNGIDTLVVLDDSIVRGTTLKESIISNLSRLNPKKIIIVSSAPQIRYPDCYGIDMSKMGDFVAFRAAVELIKERGNEKHFAAIEHDCRMELEKPVDEMQNKVKRLYEQFTDEEISAKISELAKPQGLFFDVQIIYQTIENLHQACPHHTGDWYFSGDYATAGGNRVVNRAYINWREGKNERAY